MAETQGKKRRVEEEAAEEIEVKVKRPLQKIVPVRLSSEHWSELRQYARELGIGPTTLARMWILEKLASLRMAASGSSGPSGAVLPGPQARVGRPVSLTMDQFMEMLAASLPDDVKRDMLEAGRNSMMPADADKLEDDKAMLMTGKTAAEMGKVFFRVVAGSMGIEIVEEETEASAREASAR